MLNTGHYRLKFPEMRHRNRVIPSRQHWSTRPPGAAPELPAVKSRAPHRPQTQCTRRTLASSATNGDARATVLPGCSCAETLPDTGRHSAALEDEHLSFLPALIGIRRHSATLADTANPRTSNPTATRSTLTATADSRRDSSPSWRSRRTG